MKSILFPKPIDFSLMGKSSDAEVREAISNGLQRTVLKQPLKPTFVGSVSGRNIKISPYIPFINFSFSPTFYGEISPMENGVKIQGKFEIRPLEKFFSVFFLLVCLGNAVALIGKDKKVIIDQWSFPAVGFYLGLIVVGRIGLQLAWDLRKDQIEDIKDLLRKAAKSMNG